MNQLPDTSSLIPDIEATAKTRSPLAPPTLREGFAYKKGGDFVGHGFIESLRVPLPPYRSCYAQPSAYLKGRLGGRGGLVLALTLIWMGPAYAQTQWVDVAKLDPTIVLDLRYATANNFLKQKVYPSATCLLRRPVATKLLQVQKSLLEKGYSLKLWDCYRPLSVQKKMWSIVHDSRYVADPKTGSRHNRGAAVDTTLIKKTGEPVEMPTEFDDFSEKADPDSVATWTPVAKANYQILLQAMQSSGFTVLDSEWWHYDSDGWQQYSLSNQSVKKR